MIEHKLNVVRNISDKVIALDYGRKIAEGTYEDVANDKEVIEAYLGRKRLNTVAPFRTVPPLP